MADVRLTPDHGDKIAFERVWVREAVFRDLWEVSTAALPNGLRLEDLNLTLSVSIKQPEDGQTASVALRCVVEPGEGEQKSFLELVVAVEGRFTIPDASGRERLNTFARSQAPILLFPYLRQAITTLTLATRLGGVVIPPVNMQQVITKLMAPSEEPTAK